MAFHARNQLLVRLNPGDSSAERHETLGRERVGTLGSWFLAERHVQDWMNRPGLQLLWEYGPFATGKTFISSLLVDHIRSIDTGTVEKPAVGFFYFESHDCQYNIADFGLALCSLARQLVAQLPHTSAAAVAILKRIQTIPSFPSLSVITPLLKRVISSFSSVFIVLDGVDSSERALQDLFACLVGEDVQQSSLHILMTSRYAPPQSLNSKYALPTVQTRAHDNDITDYILRQTGLLSGNQAAEDVREIRPVIIDKLDGLFIPLPSGTIIPQGITFSNILAELADVLSNSPASAKLMALSELTMTYIEKAEYGHVIRQVLQLVAKLEELGYHPTAFQVEDFLQPLELRKKDGKIFTAADVVELCAGSISFSTRSKQMRIRSPILNRHIRDENSRNNIEETILRASMRYLSQEDFYSGACTSSAALKKRFQNHPFLPFAARIISVYTSKIGRPQNILDSFLRFSSHPGSIDSYLQTIDAWPYQDEATYDELEKAEERWNYFPREYSPLHLATHIVGGRYLIEALLQQGEFTGAQTNTRQTALHIAAEIENESATLCTLLEHGADASAVDIDGETPLTIAVTKGELESVKFLVQYGADISCLDEYDLSECAQERPDIAKYLAGLGVTFPSEDGD